MSTMSDVLRTIIGASPAAAGEAMDCLRAIAVKSPIMQQRFNRTAQFALNDAQATLTAADRAAIAEHLDIDDAETRSVVTLRLTPSERAEIAQRADAAGQTVSEYMRAKLLG
jgi:hypothetical protein